MPFHFSPLISVCSANMCTVHSHDDDDDLYHNGSIRLAACFKSRTNANSFSHVKHTQTRIKQVFLGNISELLPCQWIYDTRMQSGLSFPTDCMDCTSAQHTRHWLYINTAHQILTVHQYSTPDTDCTSIQHTRHWLYISTAHQALTVHQYSTPDTDCTLIQHTRHWLYINTAHQTLTVHQHSISGTDCTLIQHTRHWQTSINSIRQEVYALLLKYISVCTEATERSLMDSGGGDGTWCTCLHQPCWPLSTSPMCLSVIMVIATSFVNIMGTQHSGIYGSAHEGWVDRVDPWNSVFPQ